jgi:hypothetical protein
MNFDDVKGIIDRSLAARGIRNKGKFVFDLRSGDDAKGNDWLWTAALALPKELVVMHESSKVLTGQKDVIGLRRAGVPTIPIGISPPWDQWLPGALVTEYVSTEGRTFKR